MHPVDLTIASLYVLGVLGLGFAVSRQIHGFRDFFVAGGRMTPAILICALVSTYYGLDEVAYRGKRKPDESYQHLEQSRETSSDALSGWLRLTRVGKNIRYEIAGADDERFVQIYEEELRERELWKYT